MGLMSDPDELEKLNREIAVIAAHIARHRDLIEQMSAEGKHTAWAELALKALSGLFKQRLQERQSIERTPDRSQDPESLNSYVINLAAHNRSVLACTTRHIPIVAQAT